MKLDAGTLTRRAEIDVEVEVVYDETERRARGPCRSRRPARGAGRSSSGRSATGRPHSEGMFSSDGFAFVENTGLARLARGASR